MAKLFAEIIGKFDGNAIKRGLEQTKKDVSNFNRAAPRMGRAIGGGFGGLGGISSGIGAGLGALAANESLQSTRAAEIAAGPLPGLEGAEAHAIQRLDEQNFLGGQMIANLQQLTEMQRAAARGDATALHVATGGEYEGKNIFQLFARAVEEWGRLNEYERRMTGMNLYDERLRQLGPGLLNQMQPTQQFETLRDIDQSISEGARKFKEVTDAITAIAGNILGGLYDFGKMVGESPFGDKLGWFFGHLADAQGRADSNQRIYEMENELYDRKADREKTNDLLRDISNKLDSD